MSSYTIIWSPEAEITYLKILEYLEENWTIKEMESFINRSEQVIEHISQYPNHYPYSKGSDSYKCVFISQVSLFYRLKDRQIEMLIFWDNRQDPAKLILK
jgi:plasmid stabilization system protein ParE